MLGDTHDESTEDRLFEGRGEAPAGGGTFAGSGGLGAGGAASAWSRVWAVASVLGPCRALEGPGPRDVHQQGSSLHTVVESTVGVQSGPGCGASHLYLAVKMKFCLVIGVVFLFVCFLTITSAQS